MEFRFASIADAEELAFFGSETFWQAYRSESDLEKKYIRAYMAKAFSVQQIRKELEDESLKFVLASSDEKRTGYAKLDFANSHTSLSGKTPMEISRIYLAKSYWGKGLGKELLEECIRIAANRGVDCIWLAVWQKNERAIRFYEKNGFVIVGEIEFDLASSLQTDHVMELRLD